MKIAACHTGRRIDAPSILDLKFDLKFDLKRSPLPEKNLDDRQVSLQPRGNCQPWLEEFALAESLSDVLPDSAQKAFRVACTGAWNMV